MKNPVAGPEIREFGYEYDGLDRMRESGRRENGGAWAYTEYDLDDTGNRVEVTGGGAPGVYGLVNPAPQQVHEYALTPVDAQARTYDAAGNYTGNGDVTVAYNANNQMIAYMDASGTTTYAYDALGRRIWKASGGVTTNFLHSGHRVVEEKPSSGTGRTYVYGVYLDEVISVRDEVPGSEVDYFYHSDDMFNVVALTDDSGAVVERYEYGDYGAPEFYAGDWTPRADTQYGNAILFTGRWFDEESGWYDFRARYMDPEVGRFTTRDPVGIWGDLVHLGNGYTYANNNPWSMMDPFGLEAGSNLVVTAGTGFDAIYALLAGLGQTLGNGFNNWLGGTFASADGLIGGLTFGQFHPFEGMHDIHGNQYHNFTYTAGELASIAGFGGVLGKLAKPLGAIPGVDKLLQGASKLRGQATDTLGRFVDDLFGAGTKGAGDAVQAADGVGLGGGVCFIAGTLVLTASGAVAIETVAPGDTVIARVEAAGEVGEYEVVRTFVTEDQPILQVTFEMPDEQAAIPGEGPAERASLSPNDRSETIGVTMEHPFWVREQGWTAAQDLSPGDQVMSVLGGWVRVGSKTYAQERATVYNLEVRTAHSYFVGESSIWVHNQCQVTPLLEVEQYSLRAVDDGFYPVLERGSNDPVAMTHLLKDDVWKFGTTMHPESRYSQPVLDSIGEHGVRIVSEFSGTKAQAVTLQNMKIQDYALQSGKLPPGNKVVN